MESCQIDSLLSDRVSERHIYIGKRSSYSFHQFFVVPIMASTTTNMRTTTPTIHMRRLRLLHHAAFSQWSSCTTAALRRMRPSTSLLIRFSRSVLCGLSGKGRTDPMNQGKIVRKPDTKHTTCVLRRLKNGSPLSSTLGAFQRVRLWSNRSSLCRCGL